MIDKYDLVFPTFLLKMRICVALNSLSINEFYNSFKYLNCIINEIILNKNDSKQFINKEIKKIAEHYGNTEQTIKTSICRIYDKCNKDFLNEEIPNGRNKLNYLDRIRIITDYALIKINKIDMN